LNLESIPFPDCRDNRQCNIAVQELNNEVVK
jgi:hypothetical protein